MRLCIVIDLDAVSPAATERRAVALVAPREHRAPIFPLSPFLAHLADTWLPANQRTPQTASYRVAPAQTRALTDRSV
jgi:hypothetical protein